MSEKSDGTGGPPEHNALEPYIIKDPEAFARNLARVIEEAGHAASAWIGPRESGEKTDNYAEPMADIVKTLSKVSEYWLSDPQRAVEAQTRLFSSYLGIWSNSIKRMNDREVSEAVEPERGDKRFSDEDWKDNAFFSFLKQTYLVTSKWASDLVENAEDLDPHTRHKASFYVKQLSNAVSPSNFMVSNPEIYKETIATNGANLVSGMKMLAEDIEAGNGELKLRQSDYSKFALGKNIAITPGKVIARNDLVEIIQYDPTTPEVLKRPLLICPPWINKFYILDLNPDKSFVRWAIEQGHTVFVMSWVNPDERQARLDWDDYIRDGICLRAGRGRRNHGRKGSQCNRILRRRYASRCRALAMFARDGDKRIATATSVHDTGRLRSFRRPEGLCRRRPAVRAGKDRMREKGYLEGSKMATAFNMLRSGDLIWPYVVNNYMKGKDPMPFDLLYWNADSTRMSAANHIYYLRNCYLENNLSQGNDASLRRAGVAGRREDPDLQPRDQGRPYRACTVGLRGKCEKFGGEVTYVAGGSGHIAGVINPPHRKKYQFWHGPKVKGTFADWMEKAEVTEGSWWPHWHSWIESDSDERVPARTKLGSKSSNRSRMRPEAT
jgi:polyhydroxyalkanoate synthase